MTTDAQRRVADNRTAFEAWAEQYLPITRNEDGRYWEPRIHLCWLAWQAALAPAPGDVRDVADAIVSWVIGPTEPGADELLAYISSVILAHSQAAVARERMLREALEEAAGRLEGFAPRADAGVIEVVARVLLNIAADLRAAAIEARGQKEGSEG